ncbi:glycosyltransferase family A protein [Thermococcus sp. LS2]|uniref:glycosyltransferase family A protein n=1 Tax=Thermococcus sp. LS2 TaxID=1638260 RepID=UPI001439F11F|nr:glycosyltransferase family 2 protein [Thermococcus sp. LS2]NJE12859.1 glycosyltransferase family 2 protein [Thermococcus sp. LS2]
MKKLKISVIIPTRNRVPYLRQLLENINNQTRIPEEVIVIGHVEDMETKNFLLNLDKEKFKFNLKFDFINGGTSKSRNMAISLSEGDVLIFLDDDVILERDYVKNVEKIFSSNPEVKIITGYTFDLVVLITPWLVNKGEVKYIWENKNDEFVKIILKELKRRHPDKTHVFEKKAKKVYFWRLLKTSRNILKSIFLWESPFKGKILPSGYRSEFPEISKIEKRGGLIEVEWIQGNNFAGRREVFEEFKFNEELEKLHSYALNEDLEWSARVSKKYKIYITSHTKLVHLRAPTGNRIDYTTRLRALIISTYYITNIKGNKIAHLWATFGLLLSIFIISILILNFRDGLKQIKAIIEALKETYKIHK